jgi:hypothetical protein
MSPLIPALHTSFSNPTSLLLNKNVTAESSGYAAKRRLVFYKFGDKENHTPHSLIHKNEFDPAILRA